MKNNKKICFIIKHNTCINSKVVTCMDKKSPKNLYDNESKQTFDNLIPWILSFLVQPSNFYMKYYSRDKYVTM